MSYESFNERNDRHLPACDFCESMRDTVIFFEYRKIQRLYGGAIKQPRPRPLVGVAVFILWLITFALNSISFDSGTITFTLQDSDLAPSGILSDVFIYVGVGLLGLTFILIIIALWWSVQHMLEAFFLVLTSSSITTLIIRNVMFRSTNQLLALAITNLVAAILLAAIVFNSIWLYDFIPNFTAWRFRNMKVGSSGRTRRSSLASFPWMATMRLILFVVLVLPLWLPLLVVFVLAFFLQFWGAPIDVLFPYAALFKLNRNFYQLDIISVRYVRKDEASTQSCALAPSTDTPLTVGEDGVQMQRAMSLSHSNEDDKEATFSAPSIDANRVPDRSPSFGANTQSERGVPSHINIEATYMPVPSVCSFERYVTGNAHCCVRPMKFVYTGAVNKEGRPHGYGTYRDSDPNGELLAGWFQDGIPHGVHRSREFKNGGTFFSVLIGVAMCTNAAVDIIQTSSSWLENCPIYALAASETCVSGVFYRGFPQVSYLSGSPPQRGASLQGIMSRLSGNTVTPASHTTPVHTPHGGPVDTSATPPYSTALEGATVVQRPSPHSRLAVDWRRYRTRYASPVHIRRGLAHLIWPGTIGDGSYVSDSELACDEAARQRSPIIREVLGPPHYKDVERMRSLHSRASEGAAAVISHLGTETLVPSSSDTSLEHTLLTSTAHEQSLDQKGENKEDFNTPDSTGYNDDVEQEVVIFIPGFNSCLNTAIGVFSQFLSLGGYPTDRIIPFVFQWPSGSLYSYVAAQKTAESIEFRLALERFLAHLALHLRGRRINFMAHSMGARALLSFISHTGVFKEYSSEERASIISLRGSRVGNALGSLAPGAGSLELGAVIFVSPEADLEAFIRSSRRIERMASSVTIYGDPRDQALFWAELLNGYIGGKPTPSLGRAVSAPLCSPYTPPVGWMDGLRGVLGSTFGSVVSCFIGGNNEPSSVLGSTTVRGGHDVDIRAPPHIDRGFDPEMGGEKVAEEEKEEEAASPIPARVVNCDVINSSSLQANVHDVRHSFFSLSREVIEDCRELLVRRRRASQRRGRLCRRQCQPYIAPGNTSHRYIHEHESEQESNIYDFLVAPSFIKY